jgi:hypothetical protein
MTLRHELTGPKREERGGFADPRHRPSMPYRFSLEFLPPPFPRWVSCSSFFPNLKSIDPVLRKQIDSYGAGLELFA